MHANAERKHGTGDKPAARMSEASCAAASHMSKTCSQPSRSICACVSSTLYTVPRAAWRTCTSPAWTRRSRMPCCASASSTHRCCWCASIGSTFHIAHMAASQTCAVVVRRTASTFSSLMRCRSFWRESHGPLGMRAAMRAAEARTNRSTCTSITCASSFDTCASCTRSITRSTYTHANVSRAASSSFAADTNTPRNKHGNLSSVVGVSQCIAPTLSLRCSANHGVSAGICADSSLLRKHTNAWHTHCSSARQRMSSRLPSASHT